MTMSNDDLERLVIAQAMFKAAGDVVSTKSCDNLRHEVDRAAVADYDDMGVKSRDLRVNGQKVGTLSIRVAKGKPGHSDIVVTDRDSFMAWAGENGLTEEKTTTVLKRDESELLAQCLRDGEMPDGCQVVDTPDTPDYVAGTTLRVDPAKVGEAMAGQLPESIHGLLEGGE